MSMLHVGCRQSLFRSIFLTTSIALTAVQMLAPTQARAWWFSHPDNGLTIEMTTPQIPQTSGQSARIDGNLQWLDENGNGRGRLEFPGGILNQFDVEASFPDPTSPVSVSIESRRGTFRFNTPTLNQNDLNVFTLTVTRKGAPRISRDLLKVQAKLDKRVQFLEARIAHLRGERRYPANYLALLEQLRDELKAISLRIAEALAQNPDILCEVKFPLQVDNQVSAPSRLVSLIGGFRYELSYSSGSAIEGSKVQATASITNLSHKLQGVHWLDPWDNGTEWVARFFWKDALVKETEPKTLGPAETLSYSFATGKLQPGATLNELRAELLRVKSKDRRTGRPTRFSSRGELPFLLPVASDNTDPVWVAGFTPDTQHPYVQNAQPVLATVRDGFGFMDRASIKATLLGSPFTGAAFTRDITSSLSVVSSDQDQTLLLSGDLNPLAEGQYTFKLEAKDLAVNSAQPNPLSLSFQVDRTAPTVTLGGTDHYLTNAPAWSIPVTVVDRSPVVTRVLHNGVEIAQSAVPSFSAAVTLREGVNLFEVVSLDAAGNASQPIHLLDVVLDTIPPVLSEIAPVENAIVNSTTIPVFGKSNEPLLFSKVNGQELLLSADKKSFSGSFNVASEGSFSLHFEAADFSGNVSSLNRDVQIVLRALNGELLGVFPDPDGTHLLVKGAPGAARPGLTVNASGSFFNSGSTVAASDGSFAIKLNAFTQASVTVFDPALNRTDSATVYWGSSDTLLSGVVKDIQGQPIAHVQVSLAGSTVPPVATNESGIFKFNEPVTGDQVLVVDGSTVPLATLPAPQRKFSITRISISIGLSQSNVMQDPIYLTPIPLDSSVPVISAAAGGEISHVDAPGVSLSIPASSAVFPDGSTSGRVYMASIPKEVATIKPPEFATPSHVIALEPSGLTFKEPAKLSLPNSDQLSPGTDLVILSLNSNKGVWEVDGAATVSEDGSSVVTKDGMGISHFSLVYAAPVSPVIRKLGSDVNPGANAQDGALSAQIQLPSFKVYGQAIAPSLLYKSSWAKPTAVITNIFDIPGQEIVIDKHTGMTVRYYKALPRVQCFLSQCYTSYKDLYDYLDIHSSGNVQVAYQPETVSAWFSMPGIQGDEVKLSGVPNHSAISYALDLEDPNNHSYPATGIYPYTASYRVKLRETVVGTIKTLRRSQYSGPQFSADSFKETRVLQELFQPDVNGQIVIQNEVNSIAGRGWKLAGPQHIANTSEDRVMIEEGNGGVSTYSVANTVSTLYDTSVLPGDLTYGVDLNDWKSARITQRETSTGKYNILKVDLSNHGVADTSGTAPILVYDTKVSGYDKTGLCPGSTNKYCTMYIDPNCPGRCNPVFTEVPLNCRYSFRQIAVAQKPSQLLTLPNGHILVSDLLGDVLETYAGKDFERFEPYGYFKDGPLVGKYSTSQTFVHQPMYTSAGEAICKGASCPVSLISLEQQTGNYCSSNWGVSCPETSAKLEVGVPACSFPGFDPSQPRNIPLPIPGFNGDGSIDQGALYGTNGIQLNKPMGIAAGPRPNTVVIADTGNNRVRLIDLTTRSILTIAGNGQTFDNGDGGLATSASLFHPRGVVYDPHGNLYVTTENGYIRKVGADGRISTFAGNALGSGASNISAKDLKLVRPTGMVIDSINGYLYVANTGANVVHRIDLFTQIAMTVAGNGSSGFNGDDRAALDTTFSAPTYLGLDDSMNLLIVDSVNNRIRRVNFQVPTSGVVAFLSNVKDGSKLSRSSSGTWTRTYRDGTLVSFDSDGHQVSAVNRAGQRTDYAYSGDRLVSVTYPSGKSTTYAYSGHQLSSIQDPAQRTTYFNYDSRGFLQKVTFPDGASRSYEYDDAGLLLTEWNERQSPTSYTYNAWNRLSSVSQPGLPTLAINDIATQTMGNEHAGVGDKPYRQQIMVVPNPDYARPRDPSRPPGAMLPIANVKVAPEDSQGRGYAVTVDRNGFVSTFSRDDDTQSIVRIRSNTDGKPVSIKKETIHGASLAEFEFTYDSNTGDLLKQKDLLTGIETSQVWDSFGNLVTSIDPRGVTTAHLYNNQGFRSSSSVSDGSSTFVTSVAYNQIGLPSFSIDVAGNKTTYTYDTNGNLASVVNPSSDLSNNTSAYSNDDAGNVLSSKNPKGQITTYSYDLFGRPLSVVNAAGTPSSKTTSYVYSPAGQILEIHDPFGKMTKFEYDLLDRLTKKTDPRGKELKMFYSLTKGYLEQEIDPNGNAKQYIYDEKGRLKSKILPEGSINFTHDLDGNLKSIANWQSVISYTYDGNGSVLSEDVAGTGALGEMLSSRINYSYSESGKRRTLSSTAYGSNIYEYDTFGRLKALVNHRLERFSFDYDNVGRISKVNRPGSISTFSYDEIHFLNAIQHKNLNGQIISEFIYGKDPLNQKTSIRSLAGTASVTYDDHNQVTSFSNPEAPLPFSSEAFSYDAKSNRTNDSVSGTYAYDNLGETLKEDFKYLYFYDDNGNLTSKQEKGLNGEVINYSYSSENQLIRISFFSSGQVDPYKTVSYAYDAVGRRVEKKVVHARIEDLQKNLVRRYTYDGEEVLLEYDGTNHLLAKYTHSGLRSDDVLSVYVTQEGEVAGIAHVAGSFQYIKDSQGTITEVLDTSGAIVQHFIYSAYGILLGINDAHAADVTANAPLKTSYGFTGREHDSESGLMYYRARYYDPSVGRFLQRDPHPGELGMPSSHINSYNYVANNPLNYTDPSGMSWWTDIRSWVITGIVAVAAVVSIALTGGGAAPAWIGALKAVGATALGSAVSAGAMAAFQEGDFWNNFSNNFHINFRISTALLVGSAFLAELSGGGMVKAGGNWLQGYVVSKNQFMFKGADFTLGNMAFFQGNTSNLWHEFGHSVIYTGLSALSGKLAPKDSAHGWTWATYIGLGLLGSPQVLNDGRFW